MGQLLPTQSLSPSQGGAWGNHRAHHGHTYGSCKQVCLSALDQKQNPVDFSSLPKISYMKTMDIYLAFCFFMVFGSLLEYATVSYTDKRIKLNQRRFEEFKTKVNKYK